MACTPDPTPLHLSCQPTSYNQSNDRLGGRQTAANEVNCPWRIRFPMSTPADPGAFLPEANNPRMVMRLVGLVAAGLRRPRAIAEIMEIEQATVDNYTHAAVWLGLVEGSHELQLTRHGLALAFAEPRQRLRHFAHAVWRTPAGRTLLTGRTALPTLPEVTVWIRENGGSADDQLTEKGASGLLKLLEPALRLRPSARTAQGEQLRLPFSSVSAHLDLESGPPPPLPTRPVQYSPGEENNLDVYARLLHALLDHGEVRTNHLRALLDEMKANDLSFAPYAEFAVKRGDAIRVGDRLVCSRGGIARRDLVRDPPLLALTDPGYREWLRIARKPVDAFTPVERRHRNELERKYRAWDHRVFGLRPSPEDIQSALAHLVPGRIADALPAAGDPGEPLAQTTGSFIENIDVKGLPVAFPRSIVMFAGGVAAANALARRNRASPSGNRLPDPVEPRKVFHGGLFPPGVDSIKLVPDTFSLRMELLTNCPALSLTAALLILDRRPDAPLQIRMEGDTPVVWWSGRTIGKLLEVHLAFAHHCGWAVATPPANGLTNAELAATARAVGIASRAGLRLVLDEELFVKLQDDPEGRFVYEQLLALEDAIHAWIQRVDALTSEP